MRHFLGVTDIGNVIDDIVGVFLEGVIGRTIEGGPAAVVIDTQTTPHIEEFDLEAHFKELGVKAGGFLDGAFNNENIRHLRADVKVKQLKAVAKIFGLKHFGGGQ